MAERSCYLVPTLVTYDQIAQFGKSHGFPEAGLRKLGDVLHAGVGAIDKALRAGVKVGFGTDLLGETHPAQSKEFALRAQIQSNADVLRAATIINADLLMHSGRLGVLKPGAFADFLLVNGNPLEDLAVLSGQGERIDVIARGGVIFKNTLH
jgi:imidazolonepropionase-like amidohydrolase